MLVNAVNLPYSADGLDMVGHFVWPTSPGPHPAVLVFPAAPGLGTQVRNTAEELGALGYAALGCDYYGHARFYGDIDEATAVFAPLARDRPDNFRARALGAYEALIARPEVDAGKVASIGYCMGGVLSMALARTGAPLSAVVGFHGGIAAGEAADNARIKAPILMCTGSMDSGAPAAVREAFAAAMAEAGVELTMSVYEGVYHSFTNPDADRYGKPDYARYDAAAHAKAWDEMLALFGRTMS